MPVQPKSCTLASCATWLVYIKARPAQCCERKPISGRCGHAGCCRQHNCMRSGLSSPKWQPVAASASGASQNSAWRRPRVTGSSQPGSPGPNSQGNWPGSSWAAAGPILTPTPQLGSKAQRLPAAAAGAAAGIGCLPRHQQAAALHSRCVRQPAEEATDPLQTSSDSSALFLEAMPVAMRWHSGALGRTGRRRERPPTGWHSSSHGSSTSALTSGSTGTNDLSLPAAPFKESAEFSNVWRTLWSPMGAMAMTAYGGSPAGLHAWKC